MPITLNSNIPLMSGAAGRNGFRVWSVAGPASYATGGQTFTAADVGLSRIDFCIASAFFNGTNYVVADLPATSADGTQILRFLWTGPAISGVLAQVTAATALAAYTGTLMVFGKGI